MSTEIENEKEWQVTFPADSLLNEEEKSKVQAIMTDLKIQACQTRDEAKAVILKLTGVEPYTPSYILLHVNK